MVQKQSSCTLSDVLITEQLKRRTSRAPNLTNENKSLHRMARISTRPVQEILEESLKIALELCEAETAGISLVENVTGEETRFRWVSVVGKLAKAAGGWTPIEASPCGVTRTRGEPQLFAEPGRLFPQLADANIIEGLVIPITAENECLGTIWVVTHSRRSAFDMEDVRVMTSLASFCAMACLFCRAHGGKGRYHVPHLRGTL